jgi:hypothetical protein
MTMLVYNTNSDTNIFNIAENTPETAVCVTTNGKRKFNGEAVMGKGIALEANKIFHISKELGELLFIHGNIPFDLGPMTYRNTRGYKYRIITFPTKHDWKNPSDINLIKSSAEKLVKICDNNHITKCYLPPVGCGLGGLDFNKDVAPVLSEILDDRFVFIIRN